MRVPPVIVDRAGLVVGFTLLEVGVGMVSVPAALIAAGILILASVLWRTR